MLMKYKLTTFFLNTNNLYYAITTATTTKYKIKRKQHQVIMISQTIDQKIIAVRVLLTKSL
jgi:hypothetical protein